MSFKRKKSKGRHRINVEAKTDGQRKYLESIKNNLITICSGYAGTGKTILAIGMALSFVQRENSPYSKIVVIRPAVEACGEKIGFLPGNISEKMRPLIQPIVDSLRVFIKDEAYIAKLLEANVSWGAPQIEVIPMGFMRGRTLSDCVVIFDEAQNASPSQVKLLLTRIGQNCKVIIEGDVTQSDAFKKREDNGLFDAIIRLRDMDNVGIVCLEATDIQRNEIIAPILERYRDVEGV